MSTSKRSKKVLAIGASATAAVLIGGGVAVAYWTTTGSGTGTATAGNVSTVTVAQAGPAVIGLYPGGPSATRDLTVTNPPGGGAVLVSGFTATPASTSAGACVAGANFTSVIGSVTAQTIAPGDTVTFPNAVTIAMKDLASNQDSCKGVTLTINYTAS